MKRLTILALILVMAVAAMGQTVATMTSPWIDYGTYIGPREASGVKLYNTGAFVFKSTTDSATAYQWMDADGGNPVLNIDTDNERVGIGTASPASTLAVSGGLIVGSAYAGGSGGVVAADGEIVVQSDIRFAGSANHYLRSLTDNARIVFRMWNGAANVDVMYLADEGYVGIGTTDFDGTPAIGKLVVKGTTNDGTTFPLMIRDSDEANVAWVNSNGVGVFTGSPTTDVASDSPVAAYLGAAGTLGYSSSTESAKAEIVDAPASDIIDQLRVREFERRPRVQVPYTVEIKEKSTEDVEVSLEDAMEVVEVDVPITIPTKDPNGPEVDISQYVDTKTVYQLDGDKIVAVESQTPKTQKIQQKQLKDGYRIDEKTGKVFHSVTTTTTKTETRYRDEYTKEAIGDGIKRIGLIAEEVNQVAPLYVYKDATGKPLGVHYDQFIGLLIQKVQDQQKQIDALEARVKTLEAK